MEFDTGLYFITDSTGFERDEFLARVDTEDADCFLRCGFYQLQKQLPA